MLQWGRDLVVADTPLYVGLTDRELKLQWGRDLVVADTGGRQVFCFQTPAVGGASGARQGSVGEPSAAAVTNQRLSIQQFTRRERSRDFFHRRGAREWNPQVSHSRSFRRLDRGPGHGPLRACGFYRPGGPHGATWRRAARSPGPTFRLPLGRSSIRQRQRVPTRPASRVRLQQLFHRRLRRPGVPDRGPVLILLC